MNLANEGLEARKKEEEVNAKKRKAEDDAKWEGGYSPNLATQTLSHIGSPENREQRVGNWRSFAAGTKKKKKTKVAILG